MNKIFDIYSQQPQHLEQTKYFISIHANPFIVLCLLPRLLMVEWM